MPRRRRFLRLLLALGLPWLAVAAPLPLLGRLRGQWLGLPPEMLWLFGCMPLVCACLGLCWLLFDRPPRTGGRDGGPRR